MSKSSTGNKIIRVVANREVIAKKIGTSSRFVNYLFSGERTTEKHLKRIKKILDRERQRLGISPEIPIE